MRLHDRVQSLSTDYVDRARGARRGGGAGCRCAVRAARRLRPAAAPAAARPRASRTFAHHSVWDRCTRAAPRARLSVSRRRSLTESGLPPPRTVDARPICRSRTSERASPWSSPCHMSSIAMSEPVGSAMKSVPGLRLLSLIFDQKKTGE